MEEVRERCLCWNSYVCMRKKAIWKEKKSPLSYSNILTMQYALTVAYDVNFAVHILNPFCG